jgi:uncharacterized iron-regulated membrane protein
VRFRHLVLVTHRWVGLVSSVVLSIVGLTGAVLAWPRVDLLHRISGPFHERLALGPLGRWIVIIATAGAIVLEISGLLLWCKKKVFWVRTRAGWRSAFVDLHHLSGALGLLLMLSLSVSGLAMVMRIPQRDPELRRVILRVHTSRGFPIPIKLVYTVGSTGFLIQGATGVAMWWKPRSRNLGSRPARFIANAMDGSKGGVT